MSTKMEQPFYHDESFLYTHADLHDYKLPKQAPQQPVSLSEPYRSLKPDSFHGDAGSLKLAAPELERLIIQNSSGVLTSPTPPGHYMYGRAITDEQEGFAEGFVKALDELHKMNQQPPPNVSIGAGGVSAPCPAFSSALQPEAPVYTTLSAYCPAPSLPSATISYLPPAHDLPTHVYQTPLTSAHLHHHSSHHQAAPPRFKEEPQTVPDMQSSSDGGSPPVSPIDMESQERIKAERKRLRNRLAATKCRRRKLERIARLEDRVKVLKSDNAGLSSTATLLRQQVAQLKQKVLRHVNGGCQLMLTSKMEAF